MKWTNDYNLPKRVIRLLPEIYQPKPNRFSVTQLIDSPRIRTLLMTKWDELVLDYSELLNTVHGMGLHRRSDALSLDEDGIKAEFKMEDKICGVTLVGRSDRYEEEEKLVVDKKSKATGFMKYPDATSGIEKQLNCYAWQFRKRGYPIKGLEADLHYRDWKLWEAEKDKPKWAAMKPGWAKAVKLFDSPQEAHDWIEMNTTPDEAFFVQNRLPKGYPEISYERLVVPLWSEKEQEDYIKEQIEYHTMKPMDCPETCRWNKGLRCKSYCPVRSLCNGV